MRALAHWLVGIVAMASLVWSCSLTTTLPEPFDGSSGGAAGATSDGGDGPCEEAADCTGNEGECVTRTCVAGVCGERFTAKDTVLGSQLDGDCLVRVCDGEGGVVKVLDMTDVAGDGKECTVEVCDAEGAGTVVSFLAPKTACGNAAMCNATGACVECVDETDCAGTPGCPGDTCVCDADQFICELKTCQNLVPDPGETDLDCGGANCSPCAVGEGCELGSDCLTGSCDDANNECLQPTCSDAVHNGSETDVDCGATCAPCADGLGCSGSTDCQSKVCTDGKCQEPTCGDGVANANETDIDCGGPLCDGCGKGLACRQDKDCKGGLICPNGTCVALKEVEPMMMAP